MKNLVSVALLSFVFVISGYAQGNTEVAQSTPSSVAKPSIPTISFTPPEQVLVRYKGGNQALQKIFAKNLQYPNDAKSYGIEGTVLLKLIIQEDGSIQGIMVRKSIGFGCDEEAVRVAKMAKDWVPARQGNYAVKSTVYVPVDFKLQ